MEGAVSLVPYTTRCVWRGMCMCVALAHVGVLLWYMYTHMSIWLHKYWLWTTDVALHLYAHVHTHTHTHTHSYPSYPPPPQIAPPCVMLLDYVTTPLLTVLIMCGVWPIGCNLPGITWLWATLYVVCGWRGNFVCRRGVGTLYVGGWGRL